MARPAPSVGRLLSILNFCVEHPQAFTATQIVKSLQLNRATGHALLAALVEEGYLHRNPDKSYVIGPGLIALAINTQRNFSPIAIARQEMRALADDLDLVAAAVFQDGEELVIQERAASRSHLGWVTGAGQRHALRGPAFPFIALSPEADVERQIADLALEAAVADDVRRGARFLRRHGFLVGVHSEEGAWSADLGTVWGTTVRLLGELEADASYRLRILYAPVLDADGRMAFAVSLFGFTREASGAEIVALGERLGAACQRITAFSAGRRSAPAF